ncbi:MAG: hypothetical protein HY904_26525 [Deltaproteobacteria bacterium]|nr:hypothetical protein [Deltaproteobacteria bacterium]
MTAAPAPSSRTHAAVAIALCALSAVVLRWAGRAPDVEGFDSVGFLLAVDHYDLAARTPHFPGYPLYLLAARAFRALGASPVDALCWPGILGAAGLVLCAAATAARLHSPRAAVGAALLALVLPGLQLAGSRPLTEGLGAALLSAALLLAVDAWRTPAPPHPLWRTFALGLLLGALWGVRPAWVAAPAGLAAPFLVARRREAAAIFGGALLACVGWLGALVLLTGPAELAEAARKVLVGHFTSWGGTALTDGLGASRVDRLGWCVLAWGLGLPWHAADGVAPAAAVAGGLLVLAAVTALPPVPHRAPLVGAAGAAALYLLVGANPENPRHAVQLLVPLVPLLAVGAARWRWLAPALAVALGLGTVPLAAEQASAAAPAVELARMLATLDPPPRFYGFTTTRTVALRAPAVTSVLVDHLDEVARAERGAAPGMVLFESRVPGKSQRRHKFIPVATFQRNHRIDPAGASITLYLYRGPQ